MVGRLTVIALALVVLRGHSSCTPHTHEPPPPTPNNILLILTDDQRWDTIQYMATLQSELAAKGITFDNSFVSVPSCCPSRASLYSGDWAHNTGVAMNSNSGVQSDAPEVDVPNGGILAYDGMTGINVSLQAAGYKTALIGKVMNQNQDFAPQVLPGWDHYVTFVQDGFNFYGIGLHPYNPGSLGYTYNVNGASPVNSIDLRVSTTAHGPADLDYSTDLTRDIAWAWLDQHDVSKPFFLVWTPYAPHFDNGFYKVSPAVRHETWAQDEGITFTTPPSYNEANMDDKPEWLRDGVTCVAQTQGACNAETACFWSGSQCRSTVWEGPAGVLPNLPTFRTETLNSLQAVDEGIAILLQKIEDMGVMKHTLVVFTSDNGYLWGEHRMGQKLAVYEESIRVPLVVRLDGVTTPGTAAQLVSNVDLAPTFAAHAGLTGETFDGTSLMPILDGTVSSWRTGVLIEAWVADSLIPNILIPNLFPNMPDYFAIRRADWKFVDYRTGTDELYDMVNDPYELVNEIGNPAHAATLSTLQTELGVLRAQ